MTYTLKQEQEWQKTISQAAREQGLEAPHVIEQNEKYYEQYFFEYFQPHIRKDHSKTFLLDAGCGTGKIAKKLAGLGFQVQGADFSEEIISLARRYAPAVNFLVTSLYNLPFPSGMFDTIICLGLFQTVGDVERALREISRVLKPGGTLIIRTLNSLSVGSLVLSKGAMRFSNPYEFASVVKSFSFKTIALKGVYVFPWPLQLLGELIVKMKLYHAFNFFFPLFAFFSHSFYLEAKKVS